MTHGGGAKENDNKNGKTEEPTEIVGDELLKSAKVQLFRQRLLNLQSTWSQSHRQSTSLKPKHENSQTSAIYRLKRNARKRIIQEQTNRLNRDIRKIQTVFAILIIVIGLLVGGLLGLLIGAGIGLLIMSLRLEF
jgi:tetrahydromethanopterin S-methyltransferase subunit G